MIVGDGAAALRIDSGDVLILDCLDQRSSRVGLHALDSVIIEKDTMISSDALRALAENGVGLVAAGNGRHAARVFAQPAAGGLELRHRQHLAVEDPKLALAIAKAFVSRRIATQLETLARLRAPTPAVLVQASTTVDTALTLTALRGHEGASTRAYRAAWGTLWSTPWEIGRRNRRPPRDPINAMLSLGYTLALGPCAREALRLGLDLALGFLHAPRMGKPVLVYDILEACRAEVESWIVRHVRSRALSPAGFETDANGCCRLRAVARRGFYADWFRYALPAVEREAQGMLRQVAILLGQPSRSLALPDSAAGLSASAETSVNSEDEQSSPSDLAVHPSDEG